MISVLPLYDHVHDLFRVQQLRPAGIELSPLPGDLHVDLLSHQPDAIVTKWLDSHIASTDCLVVFIGAHTAGQRWITYAIGKARELDKPIIGVSIHMVADENGMQSVAGDSPFVNSGLSARALAQIETYTPDFTTSVFTRSHIRYWLVDWVRAALAENARVQTGRSRRQAYGRAKG